MRRLFGLVQVEAVGWGSPSPGVPVEGMPARLASGSELAQDASLAPPVDHPAGAFGGGLLGPVCRAAARVELISLDHRHRHHRRRRIRWAKRLGHGCGDCGFARTASPVEADEERASSVGELHGEELDERDCDLLC